MKRIAACAFMAAALLAGVRPAAAKVLFTGYASGMFNLDTNARIYGPPSILGATPQGTLRARGFSLDSVGLFATTKVGEDSDFLGDFAYRQIGSTVKDLRIQYAYLDTGLAWQVRLQAGKVTLPLGYYNTRRFYPFQRPEITAPIFQSGILGLPIASAGGVLSRRFESGDDGLDVRVFGVNGYGNVPGSTATFRSASIPGGLAVSNNLGAANNNRDIAVGAQVALNRARVGEVGTSYYHGAWDPSGERLFQLAGAHLHWTPGKADILGEYVHLDVTGDEGMLKSVGSTHWLTNGGFVTVSHPLPSVGGKDLVGYARGELYASGATNGLGGHELLRSAATGAAWHLNDSITWKGEYLWLDYRIPMASLPSVTLIGYVAQLGLVVTF